MQVRPVFIIAEAGVNHNGDIRLAKQLIDQACKSKADAVKFQSFKADKLVTQTAGLAEYQQREVADSSQYEMLKRLELSTEHHFELYDYCQRCNIEFMSSAFDVESVRFLRELGVRRWKVPSGELTNYWYLKEIAQLNEEVILSTGMANIAEVCDAISLMERSGQDKDKLTVLHCTTDYPARLEDINLTAMNTIERKCGVAVGYSDHTPGIAVSIAAVARGASVIEKHFTLDKMMDGPDHKASLDPTELTELVESIRMVEKALAGSGEKVPTEAEVRNAEIVRKSLVASAGIQKGELFSVDNVVAKRPGKGLSPMLWEQLEGVQSGRDYKTEDLIEGE